jgi:hypothetical protein
VHRHVGHTHRTHHTGRRRARRYGH